MKRKTINPVAKALRDPVCKPRIVQSKVVYKRKLKHKGCDNLSQGFTYDFG
jgi:hypothetical protein